MPTYEYACSKCGHEFELFQSMKDSALTTCPKDKCKKPRWGKGKVRRLVGTGAGLIFKGSGFYITDNRSENYKAGAKKEAPPTPTPAAPAGTAAGSGTGAAGGSGSGSAPAPATPAKASPPATGSTTKPKPSSA